MCTLEARLQNAEYRNWVKAGICCIYTKEGLEDFADVESKSFYQNVLASVPAAGNPVCGITIYRRSLINPCKHPYCQAFLAAVLREGLDPNHGFTIRQDNLNNTDVSLWHSHPWELAKLFMNKGQKPTQTTPSDTDLSGIANFLRHCKVPRNHVTNVLLINDVCDARNAVMHTSDMKVTNADFIAYTQSMTNLLNDPNISRFQKAKDAMKKILEVTNASFQITLDDETKAIENLTTELHTWNVKIRQELSDLRRNIDEQKQCDETERERLEQQEDEIKKVQETLSTLTKTIGNDQVKMNDRIRDLAKDTENTRKEWQSTRQRLQNLENRQDMMEKRQHNSETQQTGFKNEIKMMDMELGATRKRLANTEGQVVNLEDRVSKTEKDTNEIKSGLDNAGRLEQECKDLKHSLINEYSRIYENWTLSPIFEGLNNEDEMQIPFDELYTEVTICTPGDRKRNLTSYDDMFQYKGKSNRNIVIKGEAGIGKSTWCVRLLHAWCKAHGGNKEPADNENVFDNDMEKAMSRFQYLFFVPLRHVDDKIDSIQDAIFSSVLERFSNSNDVLKYILKKHSDDALIVLDGVDELPSVLSDKGVNNCPVIRTTRPWKYEDISAQKSLKIDMVLTLNGLSKKGINELTCKTINYFERSHGTTLKRDELEEKCEICLAAITFHGLYGLNVPLLLIIMVLCWLENKLSSSLTGTILNMLKVIFLRGKEKVQDLEHKSQICQKEFPPCVIEDETLSYYQELLEQLGHLAYEGLKAEASESDKRLDMLHDCNGTLVFTKSQLEKYVAKQNLEISYRFGLLSKSAVFASLTEEKKVSVSFYHKLFQEFFMALWIVCNEEFHDPQVWLKHSNAIPRMRNVIGFICGLDSSFEGSLRQHMLDLCNWYPNESSSIPLRLYDILEDIETTGTHGGVEQVSTYYLQRCGVIDTHIQCKEMLETIYLYLCQIDIKDLKI